LQHFLRISNAGQDINRTGVPKVQWQQLSLHLKTARPFRYLSLTINESESIQLKNNSANISRKKFHFFSSKCGKYGKNED